MNLRALFVHFGEMKHYFIASALVFITGIVLGSGYSSQFELVLQSQLSGLSGIAKSISETSHPQLWLFVFIFLNNTIKAIFMVYIGALFGLLPLFFLLLNGMVLGYLFSHTTQPDVWMVLLKGILPHGIIEIPAIIIACAYGLRFGMLMNKGILSIFSPPRKAIVGAEIIRHVKITVPLLLLLSVSLFVAAIIESTVTLWLMKG